MDTANIEAIYGLSPLQQGILFHSLYDPESGVYVQQLSCTLSGDLDIAALERAWQRVIDRHPPLRTSFVWEQLDKPLQVVQRQVRMPITVLDWRSLDEEQQMVRMRALLQADKQRTFELTQAPL